MDRRHFTGGLLMAPGVLLSSGCAAGNSLSRKPQTDQELKGMGYIVVFNNFNPPLVLPKGLEGVSVYGFTDTGVRVIGTSFIGGGAHNHFLGATFPRWVKITYRGEEIDPSTGKKIDSRNIFAEYHIEVLSRIPEEVFAFLYAPRDPELKRAIRLKFRIKADGVLFGWDVEQMNLGRPPQLGNIKYAMMGGDFLDDMGRPFRPQDLIDTTK